MKIHRLWCNCDECLHWRGGRRIPDWHVNILEAITQELNVRPRPIIIEKSPRLVFDPPLEASHFAALARARQDIAEAMGVPTWEASLTRADLAFLKELGIDPWK